VDGENHVAGMVADAGVMLRCNVIKELVACFRDCLGSVGLSCRDCAEGGEQGGVDRLSVVEESIDNLLNVFDLVWREGGRFVFFHPLNLHAIVNGCCFIRGMLWYRW